MAKWFCVIDGQQIGPIEPTNLKQLANAGTLKPNDKVRREDMTEWRHAKQVSGLFGSSPTAQPPRFGTGAAAASNAITSDDKNPKPSDPRSIDAKPKRRWKKRILLALFLLAVLLGAVSLENRFGYSF